jgi:Putative amidase domain
MKNAPLTVVAVMISASLSACGTTSLPQQPIREVPPTVFQSTITIKKSGVFQNAQTLLFDSCPQQQSIQTNSLDLNLEKTTLEPGWYCNPHVEIEGVTTNWKSSLLYVQSDSSVTITLSGSLDEPGLSLLNDNSKPLLLEKPLLNARAMSGFRAYNAQRAANYATSYWNAIYSNIDASGYIYGFTNYNANGGNCTNFLNQVVNAGLTLNGTSSKYMWDNRDFFSDRWGSFVRYFDYNGAPPAGRSATWAGAPQMKAYATAQNNTSYGGVNFDFVTNDSHSSWLNAGAVQVGDIIFADWEGTTVEFDHSMLVTAINSAATGSTNYNRILVTYQNAGNNDPRLNRSLGEINVQYNYNAVFYVYRPVGFTGY